MKQKDITITIICRCWQLQISQIRCESEGQEQMLGRVANSQDMKYLESLRDMVIPSPGCNKRGSKLEE